MSEQQHIIALEKKIDRVEKSVDEIKTALIGNDLSSKKGIVHDVLDHGQRLDDIDELLAKYSISSMHEKLEKMEKRVDRAYYIAMGAAFVLGLMGKPLLSSILSLFK